MSNSHYNSDLTIDFEVFKKTLSDARDAWNLRKTELLSLIDKNPMLIFGFGGKGQMLAHQIRDITGREITIYDTAAVKREEARGLGFKTIEALNSNIALNWTTILGACQAQLEQSKIIASNFIFYQEAANIFNAPHLSHLARDFEAFVIGNFQELYKVYLTLHPNSKSSFINVLCFRLTGDPHYLKNTKLLSKNMWLDIPTEHKTRNYDTFLDVGAFDGDTLKTYKLQFNCSRGIAVEANQKLFDSIKKVGVLYKRGIEIMPVAAWSRVTRLRFDEVRYGMITVTESTEGQLAAAPIDDYIKESVDCLKMDIEGAESEAIKGGEKLIKCFMPDLAIAAYHRPEDFISLQNQIINLGYRQDDFIWHFGHYSDCLDDSIFYVLKK